MTIPTNKIIGALVYRTREALNANKSFMANLERYYYAENCLYDDKFHLHYYPGTPPEISATLLEIGKNFNGAKLKFPAILNFQPVREIVRSTSTTTAIYLNLAICASTESSWMTGQREVQTFDLVLRPIYEEFMRQVDRCNYFIQGYGNKPHTKYEVFTTGGKDAELVKMWGEYVDGIEIRELQLELNRRPCDRNAAQIEKENKLLTEI